MNYFIMFEYERGLLMIHQTVLYLYFFFCQILILCQPHQFKLAVNGSHLFEFRHRVQDLSSIDQLEIMGDLELTDVKLW